jgi:dTDP-4-dehydrorhamnose reductase
MLGSALFRVFAASEGYIAIGAMRSCAAALRALPGGSKLISGFDAGNADSLAIVIAEARPHVVINAVGLVKQIAAGNAVPAAVPINTLLPHRLKALAAVAGARLVHISTDCVFSGAKGNYTEDDKPDAADVYGLSKYLGEVTGDNVITLRTSIIGHELDSSNGLVEWFLAQKGKVKGFERAVFSGLPTVELSRVIRDYVLTNTELNGLFHVSAEPINKYELLRLVGEIYLRDIIIERDDSLVIDRSLNSSRFRVATGYIPPTWPDLVHSMKNSKIEGG